jgi:hypothetical protein
MYVSLSTCCIFIIPTAASLRLLLLLKRTRLLCPRALSLLLLLLFIFAAVYCDALRPFPWL